MSKKTILFLVGAAILAFVGYSWYKNSAKKDEAKEVEVSQVKAITLTQTVSATGKVQPEIEVKISSEVSGEVIELPVKEGQAIKKGQLLVRVNPDLYESGVSRSTASLSTSKAGLSQADAQLKEAKANYDRNQKLFEKGVISKSEWDKIVSAYEVAQAAKKSAYYGVQSANATVTEARDNLNRTTIYSPVDGTISLLDIELGERVLGTQQNIGTEIMRVANLNNMEVEVDVNENDIVKISVGNEADIEVDAYLKRKFKGIVTSISNSASDALTADQVTNFKVKVRILKESYQDMLAGKPGNYSPFRPGMTATVDIITERKQNVLAVPISAVVLKTDSATVQQDVAKDPAAPANGTGTAEKKYESVFVKVGDKAVLKKVTTGIQDDTNIEILSGLDKGDEVITGPYSLVSKELNANDKVKIKTAVVK